MFTTSPTEIKCDLEAKRRRETREDGEDMAQQHIIFFARAIWLQTTPPFSTSIAFASYFSFRREFQFSGISDEKNWKRKGDKNFYWWVGGWGGVNDEK